MRDSSGLWAGFGAWAKAGLPCCTCTSTKRCEGFRIDPNYQYAELEVDEASTMATVATIIEVAAENVAENRALQPASIRRAPELRMENSSTREAEAKLRGELDVASRRIGELDAELTKVKQECRCGRGGVQTT